MGIKRCAVPEIKNKRIGAIDVKPNHYRYADICKHCVHFKDREMFCEKHNFKIESWDIASKVCKDFIDGDDAL